MRFKGIKGKIYVLYSGGGSIVVWFSLIILISLLYIRLSVFYLQTSLPLLQTYKSSIFKWNRKEKKMKQKSRLYAVYYNFFVYKDTKFALNLPVQGNNALLFLIMTK